MSSCVTKNIISLFQMSIRRGEEREKRVGQLEEVGQRSDHQAEDQVEVHERIEEGDAYTYSIT